METNKDEIISNIKLIFISQKEHPLYSDLQYYFKFDDINDANIFISKYPYLIWKPKPNEDNYLIRINK